MKSIKEFFKSIKSNEVISESFNLFEIFQDDKIFKIKSFQRKYSWDSKQVDELIKDINEYDLNKNFFLGTLIIKKSKNSGKSEYSIIDGQQRITTLFLILKSIELIISQKFNIKDFEEIDSIKNIYLLNHGGKEKLKIEGYRKNTKELENILLSNQINDIQQLNDSSYKMKNYLGIMKLILKKDIFTSENAIKEFIKKIKNISFSVILLGHSIDENKVFEDLNSKGSPLLIEDLLRNYFYSKSKELSNKEKPNLSPEEIEIESNKIMENYEKSIERLEGFLIEEKRSYRSLFANKINRFFKNFILYKINNTSKLNEDNDRRMFLRYKEETKNKISHSMVIKEELSVINKYFDFCNYMSDYNSSLNNSASNLNNEKYLLNSLDFYPFIFSFYYEWPEVERDRIILFSTIIYIGLMVKNIDIWKFLQKKMHLIKTKAMDVSDKKWEVMNDLLPELLYPKQNLIFNQKEFKFWSTIEEDIKNKISDNSDIYNSIEFKRFIQYYFFMQDSRDIDFNLVDKKYDLEHILSKNIDLEKNPDSLSLFNKINKIENLCLIEKDINRNFGNNNFNEKIRIYKEDFIDKNKKSKINMVNDIFNIKNIDKLNDVLKKQKLKYNDFVDLFINELKTKWLKLKK